METALTAVLAVLPILVALAWVRRKDRANPEPRGPMIRLFLLGVLSVIPAVALELGLMALGGESRMPPGCMPLYKAFVAAAFVEEGLKYLLLRRFVFRKPHFDERMDGIVYAVMAGMGFAFLENVLYVAGSGLPVAVARAFTSIPMHACASAFMGYHLGRARFLGPRKAARAAAAGFVLAVLLHGLYDTFLFGMPVWGSFSGLGILPLLVLALIAVKRMVRHALEADAARGSVPTD